MKFTVVDKWGMISWNIMYFLLTYNLIEQIVTDLYVVLLMEATKQQNWTYTFPFGTVF